MAADSISPVSRTSAQGRPASSGRGRPRSSSETVRRYRSREKERMQSLKQLYLNLQSKHTTLDYEVHSLTKERDKLLQVIREHLPHCTLQQQATVSGASLTSHSATQAPPAQGSHSSAGRMPTTLSWFTHSQPAAGTSTQASTSLHTYHNSTFKIKEEPVSPTGCKMHAMTSNQLQHPRQGSLQIKTESFSMTNSRQVEGASSGWCLSSSRTALRQAMLKNQQSPEASHSYVDGGSALEAVVSNYSLPLWSAGSTQQAGDKGYSCTIGDLGAFHNSSTSHDLSTMSAGQAQQAETTSRSIRETHQLLAAINTTMDDEATSCGTFFTDRAATSQEYVNQTTQENGSTQIKNICMPSLNQGMSSQSTSVPSSRLTHASQNGFIAGTEIPENTGLMESQQNGSCTSLVPSSVTPSNAHMSSMLSHQPFQKQQPGQQQMELDTAQTDMGQGLECRRCTPRTVSECSDSVMAYGDSPAWPPVSHTPRLPSTLSFADRGEDSMQEDNTNTEPMQEGPPDTGTGEQHLTGPAPHKADQPTTRLTPVSHLIDTYLPSPGALDRQDPDNMPSV